MSVQDLLLDGVDVEVALDILLANNMLKGPPDGLRVLDVPDLKTEPVLTVGQHGPNGLQLRQQLFRPAIVLGEGAVVVDDVAVE